MVASILFRRPTTKATAMPTRTRQTLTTCRMFGQCRSLLERWACGAGGQYIGARGAPTPLHRRAWPARMARGPQHQLFLAGPAFWLGKGVATAVVVHQGVTATPMPRLVGWGGGETARDMASWQEVCKELGRAAGAKILSTATAAPGKGLQLRAAKATRRNCARIGARRSGHIAAAQTLVARRAARVLLLTG